MEVIVLGTGSADGWPNQWCACRSCDWARHTDHLRARTSVLIDRRLLIDPGPDAGTRAGLAGVDLSQVTHVLIGHGHPDHLDPAFLLAWSWAARSQPLTVAGPANALDLCRPWVGPDAPVHFEELSPGQELALPCTDRACSSLGVRALTAHHSITGGATPDGSALLYEISCSTGRVLYATDTCALPHDELRGRYDIVVMDETFGDRTDHGTAHLDLPGFGREVAAMRAAGNVDSDSRIVAVHLSHHNPPDLSQRLAAIGALVVDDGTVLEIGKQSARAAKHTFITGGARSGKSRHAERLAALSAHVTYVATSPAYPKDPEWVERIGVHRARRPAHWVLIESADLLAVLDSAQDGQTILIDCLTLWTTAIIDAASAWDDAKSARSAVDRAVADLQAALGRTTADVILVSNEVGSGIVPLAASARLFRDVLGVVNAKLADACHEIVLVVSGVPMTIRTTKQEY